MQIRSRIIAILAPATVVIAAGAGAGSFGAAAAATIGPVSLAPGQIQMGSSGKCVTASGTTAGSAVVLSACSTTNHKQRWELQSDGMIELAGTSEMLSAVPGTGLVQLGGLTPYSVWFPAADKTLVNVGSSRDPQDLKVLDWWGPSPQLHVFARSQKTISSGREQYAAPGTIYASTKLTNRPDSGSGGNTWALDTITRLSSVTSVGPGSYEASVVDNGTFETVPSAPGNSSSLTPDQSGPDTGAQIGDALTGSIFGTWGFSFTTAATPSAAHVATAVNGVGTATTGSWYKLFFPASTSDFGGAGPAASGPEDWSWVYTSVKDNCGNVETWTDADNIESGNISAPAPGHC